jgi:hypothetical protein
MFLDRTDELALLGQLLERERGGELLLLYGRRRRRQDRVAPPLGQPEPASLDLLDGAEGTSRAPAPQAVRRAAWLSCEHHDTNLCELVRALG